MEVIFLKDVRNQGKKGEIKEVKAGYAENFLIKKGYATKVNKNSLQQLDRENRKIAREKEQKEQNALELQKKLKNCVLEFKVRTGAGDKVFGSISPKQIKDALEKKGFSINKKQIKLEGQIATLGFHEITIELYQDIIAKIKVHVIK